MLSMPFKTFQGASIKRTDEIFRETSTFAAGGLEHAGKQRRGGPLPLREAARVVRLPWACLYGVREAWPQPVRLPAEEQLSALSDRPGEICPQGFPAK